MRYGARIQGEKNNAQQSLFGGDTVEVAVQKPAIPNTYDWSQLETLNREREAIGIYLSSHPLDKYRTVIRHLCTATLEGFGDLGSMAGQDFTVAGMVTGVQNMVSKNGKPYGRLRVEDYDGNSYEFTLFDKDYEKWRIYFFTDYFLFIRGKVQNRFGREGDWEAKIGSVMQLADVEKSLLKEVCVAVPISALDGTMVAELGRVAAAESDGNLRLCVKVRGDGATVKMFSRRYKTSLSGPLVDFLEENEVRYTIQ